MSLRLIILSCVIYLNTRISRRVLLAKVGVAEAWPIFLIATYKVDIIRQMRGNGRDIHSVAQENPSPYNLKDGTEGEYNKME